MTKTENIFLIGSFGASSVLVFGSIQSPLVGVTIYQVMPDLIWLTASLAVALSIVLMQVTKTLHPPGGATALIAVIGSDKIKKLGYLYVISPVLTGSFDLIDRRSHIQQHDTKPEISYQ